MANAKIELHPESTGLVIVDMQVEGCERHGPGMKPIIANLRRLLDRFREIEARWPGAEFVSDQEGTHAVAARVFEAWTDDGRTAETIPPEATVSAAPLSILVRGTNFQVRVWEALLRIPPGTVATYDDIAAAVGQPGATRAVGTAIGRNPVAYLIPCHRVIRKTGLFGGYHWGASRKVAMLLRENPNDGGRHEDADRLQARATASGVVDAASAPRVGRQRAFALG